MGSNCVSGRSNSLFSLASTVFQSSISKRTRLLNSSLRSDTTAPTSPCRARIRQLRRDGFPYCSFQRVYFLKDIFHGSLYVSSAAPVRRRSQSLDNPAAAKHIALGQDHRQPPLSIGYEVAGSSRRSCPELELASGGAAIGDEVITSQVTGGYTTATTVSASSVFATRPARSPWSATAESHGDGRLRLAHRDVAQLG